MSQLYLAELCMALLLIGAAVCLVLGVVLLVT